MDPADGPATPGGGCSTGQGRRATGRSTARDGAVGIGALALLGVALLLVAGSAGAAVSADGQFQSDGNDSEAPSVGDLSNVNGTALELEIEDDTDVAEDSIDASDFQISDGALESVSASEDGSDATVTLALAEPVDTDVLAVGFTGEASISDEAGNQLETEGVSRRVDGMDTVPPGVEAFTVESAGGKSVTVSVGATEPLDSASISLEGPETVWLEGRNLTTSDDGTTLSATVDLPAAGNYSAVLQGVTDRYGNTADVERTVDVATEDRPPNAVAGIDFGASGGLTVTVDATGSTAEDQIRSVAWDLGDGTEATGERVTHHYRPGNYTVTLSVTDEDGDVGSDELVVNLQDDDAEPIGSEGIVTFASEGTADDESAIVDVGAPADEPVRVARDGAPDVPIAAGDGLAVQTLTVTFSTEGIYGLAVQTDGPAAVADLSEAVEGTTPIGTLTVVHDVADDEIANVTIDVAVDGDPLDEVASDPADVRLFRHHNGSWQGLETTRLGTSNGSYRYRASSPGLSRFAVAADPNGTGEPTDAETPTATPTVTETPSENTSEPPSENTSESTIAVTNASVNRTGTDPGQVVGVSATVDNSGDDVAGFTAALSVDGEVVDTYVLTVPPDDSRPVSLAWRPNSTGSYELFVNETSAGTVTVGESDGILATLAGLFGFLPFGVLQTVVTYLGGVLVAVFLALKSIALLLGY